MSAKLEIRKVLMSSNYKAKDGTKKWDNFQVGKAFIKPNGDINIVFPPGITVSGRLTIFAKRDFEEHDRRNPGDGQEIESLPY